MRTIHRTCARIAALAAAVCFSAGAGALARNGAAADTACIDTAGVARLFDYDASAPLDVEITGREEIPEFDAVVHHVTFPSPVAGRITASVVMPREAEHRERTAGSRRYAGIVFLHWGQGTRSEFLWEGALYARAGAVSISIDAPWGRPAPWRQASEGYVDRPEVLRKMYAQTVIDIRRAADLLLGRGDVDPARIAYVGHSFGATWGGVLAGVDGRFRTHVLIGGLPTLADLEPTGRPRLDEYHERLKKALTADQLANYVATLRPMSGVCFVGGAAPASVFMQFALFDDFISEKAATRYFEAASDPKSIAWYPTSHEFNDLRSLADRARWLAREIGIAEAALCDLSRPGFVLGEAARSERLWTGVAVSEAGRIFASYPRWSEDGGHSVAEITGESPPAPYPDSTWNRWDETDDPAGRFVCVQSVYVDDEDDLWILDPASPLFRGVVPGGAKLVRVDLATNHVVRTYPLDSTVASPRSYLNDVRVDTKRRFAYISESGEGSIVIVNLRTGAARRVLAGHSSTAAEDTVIVVEGVRIKAPVHCDGIALDPKREYLYYQALRGRTLYRIATRLLRDFKTPEAALAKGVERVARTGAADGIEFDGAGNLYLTALEHNAIRRFTPGGALETVIRDPRLRWPDSLSIARDGSVYVTTSQLHLGPNRVDPYRIFRLRAD